MATWNPLTDTETGHKKPVVMGLFRRLRDMVIAMGEGAVGAQRILDAALDTTATGAGRDWVLARNAFSSAGAVGTYAFLGRPSNTGAITAGTSYAGSALRYAGALGTTGYALSVSATAPFGTWLAMGTVVATADTERATLFLRIA